MGQSINPYDGSNSADKIPPVQSHHDKEKSSDGSSAENSFAQKYWHFNADEAKKFISTLCNTITNEIKHEDEKLKETNEELKRAEQGEDQ